MIVSLLCKYDESSLETCLGRLMCMPQILQLLRERGSLQRELLIDMFTKNPSVMHFTGYSSAVNKCCNAARCAATHRTKHDVKSVFSNCEW